MQAEKLQQQCRETYLEFKREQEIKQQEPGHTRSRIYQGSRCTRYTGIPRSREHPGIGYTLDLYPFIMLGPPPDLQSPSPGPEIDPQERQRGF
jgi:hypothetical protein